MRHWRTAAQHAAAAWDCEPSRLELANGPRLLHLHRPTQESDGWDWLIVMRESSEKAVLLAMADLFKLTARKAQVLCQVGQGWNKSRYLVIF